MTGYNIFGFDNEYIYQRAFELDITDYLKKLSRLNDDVWDVLDKNLDNE